MGMAHRDIQDRADQTTQEAEVEVQAEVRAEMEDKDMRQAVIMVAKVVVTVVDRGDCSMKSLCNATRTILIRRTHRVGVYACRITSRVEPWKWTDSLNGLVNRLRRSH